MWIGIGLSITGQLGLQFVPPSLFANGELGTHISANEYPNMYQDAAATIPITAVGQPIGQITDLKG
jgi:hypothetical protein